MSTTATPPVPDEETNVDAVVKCETAVSKLRDVLTVLVDHSTAFKSLTLSVRAVIKDLEKQSKELEKYRNKKYRVTNDRKSNGVQSGITKPVSISPELAKFIGVEPDVLVARNEVTRKISAYVRENNLSDPQNRQKFILTGTEAGERLDVLLGKPGVEVSYFNLQKYIKHHYVVASAVPVPEVVPVSGPAEVIPDDPPKSVKKKVVLVKKVRRPDQLVEE